MALLSHVNRGWILQNAHMLLIVLLFAHSLYFVFVVHLRSKYTKNPPNSQRFYIFSYLCTRNSNYFNILTSKQEDGIR